jgi:intein/homing endonuclease
VLLDSGTFKRIADLNVGEHVQSYDESTGEVVAKEVTKLYEADQDHYFLINGKLKVTATHPFYTAEREWKTVSALQVGDRIASHGTPLEIVSIERVAVDHHVYNFRVEDSHNYFVSPDGQDLYLVHNCK